MSEPSSELTDHERAIADKILAHIETFPQHRRVRLFHLLAARVAGDAAFVALSNRLRESAQSIRIDGTPSQVGMSAEEMDEWATRISGE